MVVLLFSNSANQVWTEGTYCLDEISFRRSARRNSNRWTREGANTTFLLPSAIPQPPENSSHNVANPPSVLWSIKGRINRYEAILADLKVLLTHL